MSIELVLPSKKYESSYREYIAELGDEERYPFPLDFDHQDFDGLLKKLEDFASGTDLPAGYVPSTTYWLVEGEELIGVANLRHFLNDAIRECGGHIGFGIRPSKRGAGHGKTLLTLTLDKALKKGIEQVSIHTYESNQASINLIRSIGAELDSCIQAPNSSETVMRFLYLAT